MKETRTVKGLQSQIKKLESEASDLKLEIDIKKKEYNQKNQTIQSIKTNIEKINSKQNIRVSEHAILRYLERVKGVDIEQIEKEILNDKVLQLIDKLGGNGSYPSNDCSIKLSNYVVTTVIKK